MQDVFDSLLSTPLEHVVHGCNAKGVMGSGVAKQIRDKFPGCFEIYKEQVDFMTQSGLYGSLLGVDITFYDEASGKTIHNLITQEDYGGDGKKYASYLAVVDGLRNLIARDPSITMRAPRQLAIPKIGCGLGGLHWEVLKPLLLEVESQMKMEFYVYHGKV